MAPFFDQRVFDALGLTMELIQRIREEAVDSEVMKLKHPQRFPLTGKPG